MKELREFIRTQNNSAYKGVFLVAFKRIGNWCIYRSRHYEFKKYYGYYIFECKEDTDSDNLPEDFTFFKTARATLSFFIKMTQSIEEKTVGQLLTDRIEFPIGYAIKIKRSNDVCYYEYRAIKPDRIINYQVFRLKRDKLGCEKFPMHVKFCRTQLEASRKYNELVREDIDKQLLYDENKTHIALVKEAKDKHRIKMAELKKERRKRGK